MVRPARKEKGAAYPYSIMSLPCSTNKDDHAVLLKMNDGSQNSTCMEGFITKSYVVAYIFLTLMLILGSDNFVESVTNHTCSSD